MWTKKNLKNLIWKAGKISLGSSIAIYIASLFHLQFQTSAGTIALLSLMTTKWETLKLSGYRLVTFGFSTALAALIFTQSNSSWPAYGIYIFLLFLFSESLNLRATISVNAVIGAHFMQTRDFGWDFIINELLLVVIGIAVSIFLNLFHLNESNRREMVKSMRYTEKKLQMILRKMAAFLSEADESDSDVLWKEIDLLDRELQDFIRDAHEYQGNTFASHTQYYTHYFEMRYQQLGLLCSLRHELERIVPAPKQADLVADYFRYISDYVQEKNLPDKQLARLQALFVRLRKAPLPVKREEFETRAVLYHILMDLEDLVLLKKRFVDGLDERQLQQYWKQDD